METENFLIKYELRTLQSLIYFEKKELDVLASYLESFRHFIMYNKNSVDGDVTNQFRNFNKYLSAIMKLDPYPKSKEKVKLRAQIESDKHVYIRTQLLGFIDK